MWNAQQIVCLRIIYEILCVNTMAAVLPVDAATVLKKTNINNPDLHLKRWTHKSGESEKKKSDNSENMLSLKDCVPPAVQSSVRRGPVWSRCVHALVHVKGTNEWVSGCHVERGLTPWCVQTKKPLSETSNKHKGHQRAHDLLGQRFCTRKLLMSSLILSF